MLYTFKSKAAANLIMLQPSGERMLEIIGKDATAQGILLAEDMPAAITALEAALRHEEGGAQSDATGDNASAQGERVSLRQRAVPFLEMIRRSQQAGEAVTWGV